MTEEEFKAMHESIKQANINFTEALRQLRELLNQLPDMAKPSLN